MPLYTSNELDAIQQLSLDLPPLNCDGIAKVGILAFISFYESWGKDHLTCLSVHAAHAHYKFSSGKKP